MQTNRHDLADTPLSDEEFERGRIALLPRKARLASGLSQREFSKIYNIPLDTIRDWEQGRKEPDMAAKAYLKVIEHDPEQVRKFLQDETA